MCRRGAWVGIVVLSACTAANPAFEDDGGSSGPAATAADAPGSSSPGGPTTDDSPTSVTAGSSGTSSVGTDTSNELTTSADTEETGSEDPPLPQVGPYGPPERLSINDPFAEDDDPTLTEDQLELFFASYRLGSMGSDDIWVTRRETTDHDWDVPVPVTELNTGARENTPEVSLDGRTMFFSSTRGVLTAEDVFMSTRRDRLSSWSMPVPVSEINTGARDVCPFVLPSGLEMFACAGPELDALDLVHFVRSTVVDEWMGSDALMGINDPTSLDCGAWVEAGARVVVFFSYRDMDRSDLWMASRATGEGPFEPPVLVEGVNSAWYDDDPWLSQSGDVIYFASDRPGAPAQDIYMARRIDM